MTAPLDAANSDSRSYHSRIVWALLLFLFAGIYLAAIFSPPLLDDADASHAQAAAHMAETGDLVTLQVNGIRYLEKPPLPYWIVAAFYKILGENAYATHLPNALAVLGCAWIAWLWCRRAWGDRAALYAALGTLTSFGPFLFTRFYIPEALLSFLLLGALFCLLTGLESKRPSRIYLAWAALALATLTKGLIAPVFFLAAAVPFLLLSGQWRRWKQLKPFSGLLVFLVIAAPWHILAGMRNPDQGHPVGNIPTLGNVHGFWYFYFLNEHVFRFLGTRYPHDYNRLPFVAYWLLHLVWIFPSSLFFPAALVIAWRTRHSWLQHLSRDAGQTVDFYLDHAARLDVASFVFSLKFKTRSIWLLGLFAAFILLFFSLSTNQEYYTWPAWVPLIMITSGMLAGIEQAAEYEGIKESGGDLQQQVLRGAIPISNKRATSSGPSKRVAGWNAVMAAHGLFTIIGMMVAAALIWGLWQSRHLPFVADIGTLLAHRGVGDYSLSMSHFFDLTGPSFAALRLPAILAAAVLLVGPGLGLMLRLSANSAGTGPAISARRNVAATVSVALTSAVFLVAAHIAFARFAPMLSSKQLADSILQKGSPADQFIIFGDQSDASSVVFYTHRFFGRPALVLMERCSQHGNGSTLLWGSCYPDAPDIFLSEDQLASIWGHGPRHWLFAQDANRIKAEQLLQGKLIPVQTIADKTLWTDKPF